MFIKYSMTIDRDYEIYAHCNCTDCHNSYTGKLFGYLMYGYTYCYIKSNNYSFIKIIISRESTRLFK